LTNVAANRIPNLTAFGQRFAEKSHKEFHVRFFGPPGMQGCSASFL